MRTILASNSAQQAENKPKLAILAQYMNLKEILQPTDMSDGPEKWKFATINTANSKSRL